MNINETPNSISVPTEMTHVHFDNHELFSPETLPRIIMEMCKDVHSSLATKVGMLIRASAWDELINVECSPLQYHDHSTYLKDAAIVAMVKKYPYWSVSLDTKLEAMKKFIECEIKCRSVNKYVWEGGLREQPPATSAILAGVQRKISLILGEAPSFESLPFEFGPGATFGVTKNTSALDKLASHPDVTNEAYEAARIFLRSCPGWRHSGQFDLCGPIQPLSLTRRVGDRLGFVPKTAKTDRPIGIGPLMNVLLQKGIGRVIRRRLKPYLDLDNLQSRHRELAREGSISGRLATIDLSSASDTIATSVVMDLFPSEWFNLFDTVRSHYYMIEGKWYPYHKLSAMGNGFTFEVESLLFFAVAFAVCEYYGFDTSNVSVYGDDIIVPTRSYPHVVRVLSLLGFSTNETKSFSSGYFRESCGGDYFNGIDVRPFFMRDRVSFRTLFLLHNHWVRSGHRFLFPNAYKFVRKLIGKQRCSFFRGPLVEGDGHLVDESAPLQNFWRVVVSSRGVRRNKKVETWGVAWGLYRLESYFGRSRFEVIPWYKTRKFRVKYRLCRHRHI